MSEEKKDEITLEDVEAAIAVLAKWVEQQQKIQRLMARLRIPGTGPNYGGAFGLNVDYIIQRVLEEQRAKGASAQDVAIAEDVVKTLIPEEDKERLRQLAEKFKRKPST
jgi:hypothetical protein